MAKVKKPDPVHLDMLNRPIILGDSVITCRGNSMYLGRIMKITEKQVFVKWGESESRYDKAWKYGNSVCKVDGPDLTMYLLTK